MRMIDEPEHETYRVVREGRRETSGHDLMSQQTHRDAKVDTVIDQGSGRKQEDR